MLAVVTALQWQALQTHNPLLVLAATLLVALAFAGRQVFAAAILPDVILTDRERSGCVLAGAFNGIWSGLELIAYAVGAALCALVLAATGFHSTIAGHTATQGRAAPAREESTGAGRPAIPYSRPPSERRSP
jgi:Na+/melibiose symporter-like transporter